MIFFYPILFSSLFLQSQAVIFECHYLQRDWIHEYIKKIEIARTVYTCNAKILTYGVNDEKLTEVSQNHLKSFKNIDVKLVNIDNQLYDKVPQNMDDFFPNLHGFFMQDCKLENITKTDLKPFAKLKYLSLYGNLLEVIENDLFEHTPDLVFINFTWNRLKHVGSNILDTLSKLKTASFYSNICISRDVLDDKTEMKELKHELLKKCKPTHWMIEREQERYEPKKRMKNELK
jgi:hypothetical protein